ncbi:hypothetical protein GCM10027570_05820 [Streptomonospora sediminis]
MVVAQETDSARAAPRWAAIGAAVALIVLVTAGWSLVNTLIPDGSPVSPGEELALGGDGGTRAVLVLPDDGWVMDVAASHPGRSYRLERGSLRLDVEGPGEAETDRAGMAERWEGACDVLLSQDLSTEVGEPGPVASADGTEGRAAGVSRSRGSGAMVLLPAPSSGYAVRMVLQGADGGAGATAEDLARMITFSEGGEHG